MAVSGLLERRVRDVRAGVDTLRLDLGAVHDVRVSLRRLRAALAVFGELLDEIPGSLREDLRWLARQVGRTRDAEVVADRLRIHLDQAPDRRAAGVLAAALQQQAREAAAAARAALAAPRTERLVDALDELRLRAPASDEESPEVRAHRAALRSLELLSRDLPATTTAVLDPETSVSQRARLLHAQRKRVKTVRAATALLATTSGARAGLTRSLRAVQDLLGDHHDAVVTRAWLAGVAEREPAVRDLVRTIRRAERAELVQVEEQLPQAVSRVVARVDRVRRAAGAADLP